MPLNEKKYRIEPIVDLLSGEAIGQELLAGNAACPKWNESEWRDWYQFLAREIPVLLSNLSGFIFLNLHGHQFLDEQISDSMESLHPFSDRIVLEWTECQHKEEKLSAITDKVHHFKNIGFLIAIDDIGSGGGVDGLGRAMAVNASFCKIDGPYFQTIRNKGPEYFRGLCHHLSYHGARVIVEWIETEADYRLALSAGAKYGQGWFWNDLRQKK